MAVDGLTSEVVEHRYVSVLVKQSNGIILKRLFKEGADVKEGQQLYQIDPSVYEATAKGNIRSHSVNRLLSVRRQANTIKRK